MSLSASANEASAVDASVRFMKGVLTMSDLELLAAELEKAVTNAEPIGQLTSKRSITLEDAYAIQIAGIKRRNDGGDRAVGLKLGFTSKEKAAQMGVKDVIIGVITQSMYLEKGPDLDLSELLHPRIEPEIAFLLGPNVQELDLTDPDVNLLDHVTHIAAAVEVIDSRYRDFKFSLEDVVADNTSAARFRVGTWREFQPRRDLLGNSSVTLSANGTILESGTTNAILGNPLEALPTVRRLAARFGHSLPASSTVLAGAATAAVLMQRGTEYEVNVRGLGTVTVRTKA
jgi:2-oxo-3-hexenedioate decarboxylase